MTDSSSVELVDRLTARTATGLAAEISELIRSGDLLHGARLPTIRSVADAVGVSVGTVAEAWATLRQEGLVETRRRGGTRIVGAERRSAFPGWAGVDLLLCSPDTRLQPPLEPALLHALRQPGVNAWGREHMVGALQEQVAPLWPFAAEAWTSAGGGTEGLWLATRAVIRPGRPIAIDEPAPPGFLATLAELGVEVIGIPVDDEGALPGALESALAAGAAAFLHQPGGPFSPRAVLSEARAQALADVLEGSDAAIVEDDSLGLLSTAPVRTVGARLPHRTVRVLSFCKSFGLDLRTSVIGGARHLVDRAISARSGGVGSNSRILQHALAAMLRDEAALRTVEAAKERYALRRTLAVSALRDAGLTVRSGPGSLVAWVEVPDERATALALATRGIIVDVGATAFVSPQPVGLLRLSTAQLPEDPGLLDELAQLIARAVDGDLRVRFD
ncbi:aminotransferase class I/II-fold pyridoxal phosphate-dependent enzyme [Microbacterium album]|uniref:GntR family transcriptional regulator n=1 Tax=Microbacterium album TaxID=2053191 RepID=A0A917MLM0_9MICO|nr:PLP-dependent aminotransferase family protein [Microbacterium album]GGH41754.1 GntR family transcriptional regulator [Microbacterium album]